MGASATVNSMNGGIERALEAGFWIFLGGGLSDGSRSV
jgi:hypothetical protein